MHELYQGSWEKTQRHWTTLNTILSLKWPCGKPLFQWVSLRHGSAKQLRRLNRVSQQQRQDCYPAHANSSYPTSSNSWSHSISALETLGAKVKSIWSPTNPQKTVTPNDLIPGGQSPGPRSNNIGWDEPTLCIYILGRLNTNSSLGAIKNKNS